MEQTKKVLYDLLVSDAFEKCDEIIDGEYCLKPAAYRYIEGGHICPECRDKIPDVNVIKELYADEVRAAMEVFK